MTVSRYLLLLIACSAPAAASDQQSTISSIAKARPCRPANVTVSGFLHPSRHGSWISGNPGLGGAGLPIESIQSSASENKRLLTYLHRPQEYMNTTFKAVFTGVTSCNEHGIPVLNLHKIEQIEVAPVRDAG